MKPRKFRMPTEKEFDKMHNKREYARKAIEYLKRQLETGGGRLENR